MLVILRTHNIVGGEYPTSVLVGQVHMIVVDWLQ